MKTKDVWVVIEGGYDWDEPVGVFTNEEDANAKHAELTANLKKIRESNPGYGVGIQKTTLYERDG